MSSNFKNSNRDHKFIFREWLDMSLILDTDRFKGTYTVDDIEVILDNGLKMAREKVAPSCGDSDKIGAKFENGQVTTPQSTKDTYFFIQQNGLASSNYDPKNDAAVPLCVLWAINEYLVGANPAVSTLYLGTSGAAGLIEEFGSEQIKNTYLEKMFCGDWTGTMDLTEPSAGSDVGDALTKATPTSSPGVYKINGTKCFISGGDQDVTENIIHMVLARTEGAAPGTKGLSLFVVPKYLPDEKGGIGSFNHVSCVGIEHKLGLKGSPTCVLSFGDDGDCLGFLLGEPPVAGVGLGLAQMFNMMNEERLMTGTAALSLAAVAYHNAVQYASERVQGRPTADPKGKRAAIVKHEDVRRMLMFQKAHIEAFRAMVLKSFYCVDLKKHSSAPATVTAASQILEVNTPIVKAYCSDMALQCISEAMQVYGGYGFSEEYPIAELLRDARIFPIWEGTNYIQAMDLVGRKMTSSKGKGFALWLKEIADFIGQHANTPGMEREFTIMQGALADYDAMQAVLRGYSQPGQPGMVQLFATRMLHATGRLYAGKLLLEMALIARTRLESLPQDHVDYAFYCGKVASARFFVRNVVPEIGASLAIMKDGDRTALDVDEAVFAV